MKIAVTGTGMISGIGKGSHETLACVKAGRSGLGPVTLFDTIHKLPVCEVKFTNGELTSMLETSTKKKYTRTALLGMLAAADALKDASKNHSSRLRTGLVSSTSVGGMDLTENYFRETISGNGGGRLRDVVGHGCYDSTDSIAEYCGIDGFRTTISTACSSAANAVMLGARLIESGQLDRVVVGGTDSLCAFTLNGFNSLMILDKQPCRPFDKSRAGLNLGEGAAYLVLQRGDTLTQEPDCYLTGWANSNDAFHQTASSPQGRGAYLAMKGALDKACLDPTDIDYINVHGTGTANNDASEGAALGELFGNKLPPLSSTKPFTGHTLAAAGAVEAVLSVLSITDGVLYPGLNFTTPMDEIPLRPVEHYSEGNAIKHVMTNSFGFGGNSSTLIFSVH